jgi:hypothetical protein
MIARAIHKPEAHAAAGHQRVRPGTSAGIATRRTGRTTPQISTLQAWRYVHFPLMGQDEVVLRLSHDEALVLFDWLTRTDERTKAFGDLVEDQAEKRALWNLTALLERVLIEPFSAQYRELVDRARDSLRDGG